MKHRADFGFETTLAGRGHLNLVRRLKELSYTVRFFYLWLPTPDLALQRIHERVSRGGHDVPEAVVQRRFARSINNFLVHYRPIADEWILFDNSGAALSVIALQKEGKLRILETKR
ncbi:MAG TPA: hypothetical protein VEI73_07005 [Candidatus Acidoferrum sp.]|nr:hypothetical protein [Candidatus Acidoferrum sp.]